MLNEKKYKTSYYIFENYIYSGFICKLSCNESDS